MPISESTPLFSNKNLKYPSPLSLYWRIFHWSNYILGGVSFAVGSYQYFPAVSNYDLGAFLYTLGSVGFALADGTEWWTNNRVGCFYYSDFEDSFERDACTNYASSDTLFGKYQRAENGLNFFFSLLGSTLYLIGSVLYIPQLNSIIAGTQIFIIGSAIIFFSQAWKLWRVVSVKEGSAVHIKWKMLLHDLPGSFVDTFAGLGGFFYFIGSVLFLPQYDTSDDATFIAAVWFQMGGLFFFFSGLALAVRYFFTENYPH
mmetsp:Transcript_14804/g.20334  ORF Transcript_14804/g.20334 Transcript_14804/m.20334 type:complete len:258 (+) Transcript_14804:43-816(+)